MVLNNSSSFRDIEITELATARFSDSRGHSFEVTYDAPSNEVIEVECIDPTGKVRTIVKRQSQCADSMWTAMRLAKKRNTVEIQFDPESTKLHLPCQPETQSIPGLTKYLADARFDQEHGELTLASKSFSKRWIFRIDGSMEVFEETGHTHLPRFN